MSRFSRLFALAVLALIPALTYATHPTPEPDPTPLMTSTSGAAAVAGAAALSGSSSTAVNSTAVDASARAAQDQGQTQSATSDQAQSQSADNAGNSQTLNQSYQQVRQTATAYAASAGVTASCATGWGIGAQAPIAGLSFNKNRRDKDCVRFELAQDLYARGQNAAGDRVFCTISLVKAALGEDCLALVNTVEVQTGISRSELQERDRRMLQKLVK